MIARALPIALALALGPPSFAQTMSAAKLMRNDSFKAAQAHLARDYDRIIAETIRITEIPAPPFKEAARAAAVADMMREAGLSGVHIDEEGNAVGRRPGTGGALAVAIGAHLDTVFPEGIPIKVRREGDRLYAPGISDNSVSVAVLLAFARALKAANMRTRGDLIFIANVGEEERGAFRGIRYLLQRSPERAAIGAFVALEPGNSADITTVNVGVKRYTVTFTGPGGHAMLAFGLVNPAIAMADTVMRLSQFKPAEKSTIWNIGPVHGGTSINTIPASMSMSVDMRATDAADLDRLDAAFRAAVAAGVTGENAARSTANGTITAKIESALPIERPVTRIAEDAPLVRHAQDAFRAGGMNPAFRHGSSDSMVAQRMKLPGITLDSGMEYIAPHSPSEAIVLDRPSNLRVMVSTLATVLLAANDR